MKRTVLNILFGIGFALALPMQLNAATETDLVESDLVLQQVARSGKPLVFNDEGLKSLDGTATQLPDGSAITYEYLPSRRALTGLDCKINRLIKTVDVGSGSTNLNNLLDDDLNNCSTFISTATVGVGYNPLLSICDNSCYYAKGTTAGFNIVAGSGNTVLSLDVVKMLSITFYRDGELIETVTVSEGQDGSGVNLSLVNIPGSEESGMNLTAVAPCVFDEISLDFDGGANVGVGQVYKIKYAFVGDAREFSITKSTVNGSIPATDGASTPFRDYNPEKNGAVGLDYAKGWNPVLLGIPFPVTSKEVEKFINDDFDDYLTLTPVLGLVYMGGAKFMMKDESDSKREVYDAGMEVGFSYKNGSALDLSLGNTIQIILFDRNGNEVQTETVSAGVLGLSVAKGGDGSACIVSKVPFSGAELRFYGALEVNLGALGVHYAFVREQPTIRHHCPIEPSAGISLCDDQNSFQLLSNPDIPVKWSFKTFTPKYPEDGYATSVTVTDGGLVKNLDIPGDYIFVATAADGCTEETSISYASFPAADEIETQGEPLVNGLLGFDGGQYELSVYHKENSSGGLIIIDGAEGSPAIIDDDINNCATWTGLELASNQMIVGVHRKDGMIVDYAAKGIGGDGDPELRRVGFVISSSVVGLNLNVLNFWNIRCYHNGVEVYRHVVDESNAVSAALGGSQGNTQTGINQTRYSIPLPLYDQNGNYMAVDEIQLWSSGVLNLDASKIDIYYGFVEDESENGCSPLSCSATVISSSTTGASIDYSLFGDASLVQALGAINNISYFIDDDPGMNTALVESHVAGVASRVTIPVKIGRTLDFRHELGIVMRDDSYVANVDLGGGLTVYTMYKGEATGDKFTQWNVLGADVAGYGDKQIFYIHPKRLYDEVVIDYGNALAVGSSPEFFGLFMRSDSDADGIPDCQDPCSCNSTIKDIEIDDVCVGSDIYIVATGNPGNVYKVQFNDPAAIEYFGGEYADFSAAETTEDNLVISYPTKSSGRYQMTFYDTSDTPISSSVYYVHPQTTTWRTNAASREWSNWSNWSEGTPYCCTNVIIPQDASVYPALSGANDNGDEFCCNGIFIRPGASIASVDKLNYQKAWVQMEVSPNCYNLISAPLKGMVTGDMFIPAADEGVHNPEPFTALDNTNSEENRFNPTIYQRMWYSSVPEQRLDSKEDYWLTDLEEVAVDDVAKTKWSQSFNHLNTAYTPGMGFSIWVDEGKLGNVGRFRFTFPKEHSEYNYFDDFSGQKIDGLTETALLRGDDASGRFIYEQTPSRSWQKTVNQSNEADNIVYDRKLYEMAAGGLSLKLSAGEDTGHFLMGNPFMSNINSRRFIRANSEVISGIVSYDGNVASTLLYDADSDVFVGTGAVEEIAPMTAVYLIARNNVPQLTVVFDEDMIAADVEAIDEPALEAISVKASAKGSTSAMTALTGSDLTNQLLFDSEVAPQLAVFSAVDGHACDIMPATDAMPLTIIAPADSEIRLDFITYGVDRSEWTLADRLSSIEYPLERELILPAGTGTSSGRFVLRKASGLTTGTRAELETSGDVYLTVADGCITAHSISATLLAVEVYDLGGVKLASVSSAEEKSELSLQVVSGIYVVRTVSADGTTSHKLRI